MIKNRMDGLAEKTLAALGAGDSDSALRMVTELAINAGLGVFGGVCSRVGAEGFTTLGATDEVVEELERLQQQFHEGPSFTAFTDEDVMLCRDVSADERWPNWGPVAGEMGVQGMISIRLRVEAVVLGTLNLYTAGPGDFTFDDLDAARLLGTHASIALSHARDRDHLWEAINARHRIGLAQGILMERFGIDSDHAFDALRRLSRTGNIKLSALAEQILQTRMIPKQGVLADRAAAGHADSAAVHRSKTVARERVRPSSGIRIVAPQPTVTALPEKTVTVLRSVKA